MQVVTKAIISKPPDKLWPLLCSSRMDPEIPCLFRFGIPKPVECRLPDGVGGVGHQRQCVSDRGIINQRIIQWDEPNTLRFEMEDTNLYFRPCIDSIIEEFQLKAISSTQTEIKRTTTLTAQGAGAQVKGIIMCIGMKFIHRYVFRNWARETS